jgi:hypothetical protein
MKMLVEIGETAILVIDNSKKIGIKLYCITGKNGWLKNLLWY